MKINFEVVLKRLNSDPLPEQSDVQQCSNCGFQGGVRIESGKRTLKSVAVEALQLSFADEQQISGEEKAKRWVLATRIYANPENIDLKTEEISIIKKLIGKAYGPLIVGQAWKILDPASIKGDETEIGGTA